MEKIITRSEIETEQLGATLAASFAPLDVVCLYGELGAGKTTLVKGIARGLSIADRVISPTFAIVREHTSDEANSHIKKMYHLDLYRLENEEGVKGIGLDDMLRDDAAIILIEWPEKLGSLLPKKRTDITMISKGSNREIRIQKIGE